MPNAPRQSWIERSRTTFTLGWIFGLVLVGVLVIFGVTRHTHWTWATRNLPDRPVQGNIHTGAAGGRGGDEAFTLTPDQPLGARLESYLGQRVMFEAKVTTFLSPMAFAAAQQGIEGGNEIPVVMVVKDASQIPMQGQRVLITGDVRPLIVDEVQRNYSMILDPIPLSAWLGKPVVVATDIQMR